jgi:Tol biopolymer transport system component
MNCHPIRTLGIAGAGLVSIVAAAACGSATSDEGQHPVVPRDLVVFSNGETLAVDTQSGAVRHLQGPLKDVQYIPSPDGAKLVIGCGDDGSADIGADDAGICMYTDAGYRQLSRSSDLMHPGLVEDDATQLEGSWSPDSQRFTFLVRDRAGDIYVVDVRSGAVQRIAEGEFAKLRGPLLWSPDGTHIATRNSPRLGGGDELEVIDAATGATVGSLLAPGGREGSIEQYAWSPDSKTLAFTWNDGSVHLYIAAADQSEVRQLTTALGDTAPVWSPDGAWIAADDLRGSFSTVFAIRADGSGRVELGSDLQRSSQPVWAPDSTHMAFSGSASAEFNDRRLFIGDIGGDKPRQVADETLAFFPQIAFSSDGKRLFYTAEAGPCIEGCPPGYLFMAPADGASPAVKLHDAPVYRFLGWLP